MSDTVQTGFREVEIVVHHPDDLREGLEIRPFLGAEWIAFEELDNLVEVVEATNAIIHPITVIRSDASEAEKVSDPFEQHNVAFVLCYPELGKDLPSQAHFLDPVDSDIEAPFTVYETGNPTRI
jgi:hypothetical protein